jgi:AraC family transcriptional regulator
MAPSADPTVWPPTARSGSAAVGVDRCAVDPAAPPKDWVYAAPGAVVLGNAGEHFQVRHHDALGNRRAFAILPHNLLEEVANAEQLGTARFTSIAIAPGPATTRMLRCLHAIKRDSGGAEEAAYALAGATLRAPDAPEKRVSTNNRARVYTAARYIDEHFAEPCALNTISQAVNLSRYELIRAFSAVLGQSPNQYLINTRIRAAAEQLEATATPIADVAFGVGFNDISYFYHCFRTAFGCTPLQWRQRR